MAEVLFRPAEKTDMGFVLKSWIRSYARSPWSGALSRDLLCQAIKGTILDLLDRDGCNLIVACNPLDKNQIWGFVCYETKAPWPLLHYVYVKELFRGMGIGGDLVTLSRGKGQGQIRYTHRTQACKKLLPQARFVPELARRKTKTTEEVDDGFEEHDSP